MVGKRDSDLQQQSSSFVFFLSSWTRIRGEIVKSHFGECTSCRTATEMLALVWLSSNYCHWHKSKQFSEATDPWNVSTIFVHVILLDANQPKDKPFRIRSSFSASSSPILKKIFFAFMKLITLKCAQTCPSSVHL